MIDFLFDYGTLRIIWWGLLGTLLIGFAVTDGFDLGVGALLPFVAKSDLERRVAINTVGPVWEGNQVWFVLGGGAIFAAWPALYALSFSGFYLAMFLVLMALILRPVAFKYRSKRESAQMAAQLGLGTVHRRCGSGADLRCRRRQRAAGRPVPLHRRSAPDLRRHALRPAQPACHLLRARLGRHAGHARRLLAGLQGGGGRRRIALRAPGPERGGDHRPCSSRAAASLVALGAFGGYHVTSAIVADGPSNPLMKTVASQPTAWLANFAPHPWMALAPALGIVAP